MDFLIVIPARYESKRFPGKPLAKIAGKEMLLHVWSIAKAVQSQKSNVSILIATDDARIESFCQQQGLDYTMTSLSCQSGTERTAEVVAKLETRPRFVINLQGDNPLCPTWFITDIIDCFEQYPESSVITPYVPLDWQALDALRHHKQTQPFSGTTVLVNAQHDAIWFSKQILPAIRNEVLLKNQQRYTPVKRHIGLYGYTPDALLQIARLQPSAYADLEGLEQLTILEAGIPIKMVAVDYKDLKGMNGVDTPEDLLIAEQLIEKMLNKKN